MLDIDCILHRAFHTCRLYTTDFFVRLQLHVRYIRKESTIRNTARHVTGVVFAEMRNDPTFYRDIAYWTYIRRRADPCMSDGNRPYKFTIYNYHTVHIHYYISHNGLQSIRCRERSFHDKSRECRNQTWKYIQYIYLHTCFYPNWVKTHERLSHI
jgi:hypothetical protein